MTEIGLQNIQYCNILNAFGIIMELEIYVKKNNESSGASIEPCGNLKGTQFAIKREPLRITILYLSLM